MSNELIPEQYGSVIKDIKQRILKAQYIALKSVNKATDLQECVSIAKNSLESGSALEKLKSLIEVSGGVINKLNSLL